MNDALEILNEIQNLINDMINPEGLELIEEYITNKRLEFEPARGDCCG